MNKHQYFHDLILCITICVFKPFGEYEIGFLPKNRFLEKLTYFQKHLRCACVLLIRQQ